MTLIGIFLAQVANTTLQHISSCHLKFGWLIIHQFSNLSHLNYIGHALFQNKRSSQYYLLNLQTNQQNPKREKTKQKHKATKSKQTKHISLYIPCWFFFSPKVPFSIFFIQVQWPTDASHYTLNRPKPLRKKKIPLLGSFGNT